MVYGASESNFEEKHTWIVCKCCGKKTLFVNRIDGIDNNGFVIGWDNVLKPRPVSFCSFECKNLFEGR